MIVALVYIAPVYIAGVLGTLSLCSYLYVARGWYKEIYTPGIDLVHVWSTSLLWPLGILVIAGRLVSEQTVERAKRLKQEKRLAAIEMDRAMQEVERLMRTEVK